MAKNYWVQLKDFEQNIIFELDVKHFNRVLALNNVLTEYKRQKGDPDKVVFVSVLEC